MQNALKKISLADLVLTAKRELGCNIILLDEITSLKEDWNYKVKELWDRIENKEKLFIIVAGSVGVLIEEGYSLLSARRGFCPTRANGSKTLSNPAVILPAKFSAHISEELFTKIFHLKYEQRIKDLIDLSAGDKKIIKRYNNLEPEIIDRLNGELGLYLDLGVIPS